MKKLVITLFLLFSALGCQRFQSDNFLTSENEVNFCDLVNSPDQYKFKNIQTKAIVLGYHNFIFYNNLCLSQNNILALEMSYESRHKIAEVINASKINYKTDYIKHNIYAEIAVSGELKENDEKEQTDEIHLKYKFFVSEVKNINVMSEEILPTEK